MPSARGNIGRQFNNRGARARAAKGSKRAYDRIGDFRDGFGSRKKARDGFEKGFLVKTVKTLGAIPAVKRHLCTAG